MNEKKEKIKKFFRDHRDDITFASIVVGGSVASLAISNMIVKRVVAPYAITDVDHECEEKNPIYITLKSGEVRAWIYRPEKTEV